MEELLVIAYPYAAQTGYIKVPENMDEDSKRKYVENHWSEIDFEEPDLDYEGTDFDIEEA